MEPSTDEIPLEVSTSAVKKLKDDTVLVASDQHHTQHNHGQQHNADTHSTPIAAAAYKSAAEGESEAINTTTSMSQPHGTVVPGTVLEHAETHTSSPHETEAVVEAKLSKQGNFYFIFFEVLVYRERKRERVRELESEREREREKEKERERERERERKRERERERKRQMW
jgi:hypothetical protein